MKKSEIIATILSIVAEETELEIKSILSQDRHRETVDARHITIFLMSKHGIYTSNIAEIFGTTPRNVQYIITDFDTRLLFSTPMRKDYERIANRIGKEFEINAK